MRQDVICLPAMSLRRRHKLQPAVLVILVVPAYKFVHPGLCLLHAAERFARVVRPVFAGPEERFCVRIIVAHPRPAERRRHTQILQRRQHGGTLHRAAVTGAIGAKLGEQIAVAIANRNSCEYCLAAHTVFGKKAGATVEEMAAAQVGRSSEPKTAAALDFALKVVSKRAQVSAADVEALRTAGFSEEQTVEILAHVALNIFTNYINVALNVPVDFPRVALIAQD